GPVVVTCDGCGVRIRIPKPETALNRQCPRCSTPLVSAVTKALEAALLREESPLGIDLGITPEPPLDAEVQPKTWGVSLLVAWVPVFVGSALPLGLWLARDNASKAVAASRPVASREPGPSSPLALGHPDSAGPPAVRPPRIEGE